MKNSTTTPNQNHIKRLVNRINYSSEQKPSYNENQYNNVSINDTFYDYKKSDFTVISELEQTEHIKQVTDAYESIFQDITLHINKFSNINLDIHGQEITRLANTILSSFYLL